MNVETKTLPIQGPGVFAIKDIPCSALVLAIDDTRVIDSDHCDYLPYDQAATTC